MRGSEIYWHCQARSLGEGEQFIDTGAARESRTDEYKPAPTTMTSASAGLLSLALAAGIKHLRPSSGPRKTLDGTKLCCRLGSRAIMTSHKNPCGEALGQLETLKRLSFLNRCRLPSALVGAQKTPTGWNT